MDLHRRPEGIQEDGLERGRFIYRDEEKIKKLMNEMYKAEATCIVGGGAIIITAIFTGLLVLYLLFLAVILIGFLGFYTQWAIYLREPRLGLYTNGIQINRAFRRMFVRYSQIDRLELDLQPGGANVYLTAKTVAKNRVRVPLFVIGKDGYGYLEAQRKISQPTAA